MAKSQPVRWLAAAFAALAVGVASPAAASGCDRACLEGMVDAYLKAMVAHDTGAAPLAADVKVSENGQLLSPGDGSFQTVDGLGIYRHVFADPQTGNAGAITTVTEHGAKALLDLRLRVADGRIAEVETMIIRDPGGNDRYEALGKPEATWLETVPEKDRMNRADMIRTVNRYFSSMQHNDGRDDYTFFHPDCDRLEHGLKTTNVGSKAAYGHSTNTDFASLSCRGQFELGFLGFVTQIRDRRFLVVDEERQTLLAMVYLDHNGSIRRLPLTNGGEFVLPPYFNVPRGLQVIEGFKLKDGMIYRIEMTLIETPYGSQPPWQDAADVKVIP